MFSLFKIKERKAIIREEAVSVMRQARDAAQRTVEHTSALGALLSTEIKEYVDHQAKRAVMAILACLLLLGAYFTFCAFLVALLSLWLEVVWALGVVALVNLVVAVLLLLRFKAMSGKQIAPATMEELKNDWQCLKLLCKGNNES